MLFILAVSWAGFQRVAMIRCSIDSHVISKFSEDCHGVGNTYHFMARRLTEGTCSNQWVCIIVLNGYWRFMFTSSLDEYIESYRNRNSNLTSKNMNQEAGTQESCMIFRVFFLNLQYAGLVPLETWLASTGSSPWRWRRPLLVHPGGRYLGETWHRKSMNIWRREHSKKSWLSLVKSIVILVKSG